MDGKLINIQINDHSNGKGFFIFNTYRAALSFILVQRWYPFDYSMY